MPTSLPPSPFHPPNVMQPPSSVSTKPVLNVAAKFSVNLITYRNAGAQFSLPVTTLAVPYAFSGTLGQTGSGGPESTPIELISLRKRQGVTSVSLSGEEDGPLLEHSSSKSEPREDRGCSVLPSSNSPLHCRGDLTFALVDLCISHCCPGTLSSKLVQPWPTCHSHLPTFLCS